MKLIRLQKLSVFSMLGILAALLLAVASVQAQNAVEQPTLRGDEAVERLKQNGQYDSLMDAVKEARRENGQPDDGGQQNAVGQSAKLTASDGATNDYFGFSVSISGDTAIVGAVNDGVGGNALQGSAYVFVRSGTTWSQQAQLVAADGAAVDAFGFSVSISGDTAIVSAVQDNVGANTDQGSAYVFIRSGTIWSQQAQLVAPDGMEFEYFGRSVSIFGDTAIVGAYADDVGANENQGSAHVFIRSGTIWAQQAQLVAADGAANDYFGFSVSLFGDTAIVGASSDDVGENANQGSAYIFTRSGADWSQQSKLTASDGSADDQFSRSVSISGDTAIVGASSDDVGANTDQGSAYVFIRSGATWSQQAKLTASDGAANDQFGYSVSISGDAAIVGAHLDDVFGNTDQGSAYVFTRSETTWSRQTQLFIADGGADRFGTSVAISGSNFVVGAFGSDVGANADQGAVYAFLVLSPNWTQEAKKVVSDGAAGDFFGYSVAISGDTAIIGAYADDVGANTDQGSAYVFIRSGTIWSQQAKLTAADGAAGDFFGYSVAISGDTTIIGAYADDVGANANQGSAYIFIRSGTTWSQQPKLIVADGAADDNFGFSVAISSGTAIVGAPRDDVGANVDQGSAYVFTRSGTRTQIFGSNGAADDRFGFSVSISGDTAVVGAFFDDVLGKIDQGSAYVFIRSGTFWLQEQRLLAADGAAGDLFGNSVAISGNTIIVGAYGDDVGANADQGSAYVFERFGTGWLQQAQLVAADGAAVDFFGTSVSISGDAAVVGADGDNVGANTNQGSAYVFERAGASWSQKAKLTDSAGAASNSFGTSVSIFGDKIIVGAPFSDASVSTPLSGDGNNDFVPTAVNQGTALFFVNEPLAPTAASATVGGRVTIGNRGLHNARVTMTNASGETRTVVTNPFGYYRFTDVPAGETYIFTVSAKRRTFSQPTQVRNILGETDDINFEADNWQ